MAWSYPASGNLLMFPPCRKVFYRVRQSPIEKRKTRMPSDQALLRSTACAIVDRLNSGEVTPLDLLDTLERRIADVDGKTNALPILCFDRARENAKALMQK